MRARRPKASRPRKGVRSLRRVAQITARARWGREAFEEFFEHIVWQCVEAGLVSGDKIFCDASLIDADAANNHGFKRSRWRGLGKITIQYLMIAAAQNIRILIKHARKPAGAAREMRMAGRKAAPAAAPLYQSLYFAMISLLGVIKSSNCRCSETAYT